MGTRTAAPSSTTWPPASSTSFHDHGSPPVRQQSDGELSNADADADADMDIDYAFLSRNTGAGVFPAAHIPVASTSTSASMASPPAASTSSFHHNTANRHHRDSSSGSTTSTDGVQDDEHPTPSLSLARRRYPSSATRRAISRSSTSERKGKSSARWGDDNNQDNTSDNNYATYPADAAIVDSSDGDEHDNHAQLALLPPRPPLAATTRRHTGGLDPFVATSSPPASDSRVRKKRSNTTVGSPLLLNGDGAKHGEFSSGADLANRPGLPHARPPHSARLSDHRRSRTSHLPRSASDHIVSPSSSAGIRRPSSNKRPPLSGSGSNSPQTHSYSASNLLQNGGRFASADDEQAKTAPGSTSQLSSSHHPAGTYPPLKNKLSGLQMRQKKAHRERGSSLIRYSSSHEVQQTYASSPRTASPQPVSARKRAKSAMYPSDLGTTTHLQPAPRASSSSSRTPTGYVSRKRPVSASGEDLQDAIAVVRKDYHSKPREEIVEHPSPLPSASAPHAQMPSYGSLTLHGLVPSASQPVSIASLVASDSYSSATAAAPSGPSLQELLGQVDLQSALNLVRANNSSSGFTSTTNAVRKSTATARSGSPAFQRPSYDSQLPLRAASPAHTADHSVLSSQTSTRSLNTGTGSSSYHGRTPLLPKSRPTSQIQPTSAAKKTRIAAAQQDSSIPSSSSANGTISTDFAAFGSTAASSEDAAVTAGKKRNRLSIRRLFPASHGNSGRKSGKSSDKESQAALSEATIFELADASRTEDGDESSYKVTPTMGKYIESVKKELEIRYLPIYTALAVGQPPTNPLAVARARAASLAESSSSARLSHYPSDLNGTFSSMNSRSRRTSLQSEGNLSIYDRIRRKGYRRSVWEIHPRDIASFAMAPPKVSALQRDDTHTSLVDFGQSRSRPVNHRHASSEISLGSLSSIREDRAVAAFMRDKNRDFTNVASFSMSPTRSAHSDRSSLLLSDDGQIHSHEMLARSGRRGSVPDRARRQSDTGLHSSPDQPTRHKIGLHGAKSPESHLQSSRNSHGDLRRQIYHHGHRTAGEESDSAVEQLGSPTRLARSTASDAELGRSRYPSILARSRPQLSRNTSRSSSMAGFGRILTARKSQRQQNGRDQSDYGYRSTDIDENPNGYLSDRSTRWRRESPFPQPDLALTRATTRTVDTENDLDRDEVGRRLTFGDDSIFERSGHLQVQEMDIDDEEMDRAESLLQDLRSSLGKAESLTARVPPKMHTYLQEYIEHDSHRRNKSHLSTIPLPSPPSLCRHFIKDRKVPAFTPTGPTSPLLDPLDMLSSLSSDDSDRDHHITAKGDAYMGIRNRRQHDKHSGIETSIDEEPLHVPLLEAVGTDLDGAHAACEATNTQCQELLDRQDAVRERVKQVGEEADNIERMISSEVFQQLRLLEDHLIRLRYQMSDAGGYVDAAWAVLSYVLQVFFWCSWIIVTIFRIAKFIVMLPFTVVVRILRWLFI